MDLRKLRDKATEAFTKGKFGKAAELYEDYCKKDPRDLQARLRMGDAWAKAGERAKAITAYKSAAEGFAKEGFLPRAIAASKLILELDPAHQGVQQMLADLYARKGGGSAPRPQAPARKPPADRYAPIELEPEEPAAPEQGGAPAAPPKHAPIELPPDPPPEDERPRGKYEPIELPPEPPDFSASARAVEDPADSLPPELQVFEEAAPPPPPPSEEQVFTLEVEPASAAAASEEVIPLDQPRVPAPPPEALVEGVGPPGLRRKPATDAPAEPEPVAEPLEVIEVPAEPVPPPAASPASSSPAAASSVAASSSAASPAAAPPASESPAATASSSRIWIPGAQASAEPAPPVRNEVASAPAVGWVRGTNSDLERAFSRFDELSLDDAPLPASAPAPEAAPAATAAQKLPSFTELELEGDSLLHAVEVAALAGQSQRGEDAGEDEEEEVFSLTAEVSAEEGAAELPKIPLFSDLPPDAFIELFDRCPLRRYGQGERIIAQGSVGDAFYVVCEGEVRVVREDAEGPRELALLGDGAFFGEMALLSGAPRSASVDSASDDTQLLEISAPVLAQLSHRYPSVARALKRFCRQRMLSNVMQSSPLFRPFSRQDRKTLVERFRARDVNKGAVLIQEGQQTDGLYVVLSGEVEVTSRDQTLARLREGEVFGEMSLLKKSPATASVISNRRTSLLRLPREDFDALVLSHPQILVLVAELTEDRQRATEAVLSGTAEVGEQGLLLV